MRTKLQGQLRDGENRNRVDVTMQEFIVKGSKNQF